MTPGETSAVPFATDAPVGARRAGDYINVDLSLPDAFGHQVPYDAFATLRSAAPVPWTDELPNVGDRWRPSPGFWNVVDHALVTEVSRRPETFSSWLGTTSMTTPR